MIKESEQWKPVVGYEGLYEVSNHGRVKSTPRNGTKGGFIKIKVNQNGYLYVNISKKFKKKNVRIHRLVAIHFINNPENKPQVNHIDGNKLNNYYKNLEWCTHSENIQHAWKLGLCENTRKDCSVTGKKYGKINGKINGLKSSKGNKINHLSDKIYCKELDEIFESMIDVEKKLNVHRSSISRCCNGKRKSAGKHPETNEPLTWKFV